MGNFFNIQDLLSKESSPIHLNISICTEIQTMLFITKILSEFIQKISFMEAGQIGGNFLQSSGCILLHIKWFQTDLSSISAFEPFYFLVMFFETSVEQANLEVLYKLTWSIIIKGYSMNYSAKNENFMFSSLYMKLCLRSSPTRPLT